MFLNSWQLIIFKTLQTSFNLANSVSQKVLAQAKTLPTFKMPRISSRLAKFSQKLFKKIFTSKTSHKELAKAISQLKIKKALKQLSQKIYDYLSKLFEIPLHLIFPKGQTSKIASRYASTSTLFFGFVLGIYFTLSEVLIPRIRALTESTYTMPTDTIFNQADTSTLTGFSDNSGLILATNSEVKMDAAADWWDADYAYQKPITISNLSAETATNSASITVDTATLVSASKLQADCDDLRVVYSSDGTTHQEIARSYNIQAGASDCSDSESTIVTFPLEAEIAASGTDNDYYLYYGNSTTSDLSMPMEKYLTFDGTDDLVTIPDPSNGSLDFGVNDFSISMWVKSDDLSTQNDLFGKGHFVHLTADDDLGTYQVSLNNSTRLYLQLGNSETGIESFITLSTTLSSDTWYHLSIVFDRDANATVYINGSAVGSLDISSLASIQLSNTKNLKIGDFQGAFEEFDGSIDEVAIYRKALTAAEVQAQYNSGKASSVVNESNLALLLHFDEGSGQTVSDSSSNSNDGTLGSSSGSDSTDPSWTDSSNKARAFNIYRSDGSVVNSTLVCPFSGSTTCIDGETPSTETGAIRYDQSSVGSALSFDGVDDVVTIADSENLRQSQQSFSFWMKSSINPAVFAGFVSHASSDGYNILQRPDGKVAAYRRIAGSWHYITSTASVTDGNWHHVVAIFNDTTISLYVDGSLNSSTDNASSTVFTNTDYKIGAYSTNRLIGSLDELAIYNSVLSADEITALYNSGSPAPITPDANTVLLYHFDENGDDPRNTGKVIDSSGNANHGTINGDAKYTDGKVPAQTYAGHQGIFIEEGTTNLVENPSFETNITDFWDPTSDITAYTNSATDADGNTFLGSDTVNDVYFYDTANDSSAAVQVDLDIDPNWRKGVVLTTGTLSTTNNGSLIEVTGTNANGNAITITVASSTTFNWTDGGIYSGSGVAMSAGSWVQLETGDDDIWVRFDSDASFNTNDVFTINSWVIEPFSTTRGYRRDFPEQAWLVATDSTLDIIDAVENKLWMRFSKGTDSLTSVNMITGTNGGTITSNFVKNGIIYVGQSGAGLVSIYFNSDSSHMYYSGVSSFDYDSNIASRNSASGDYSDVSDVSLVNANVNDVHAAVIDTGGGAYKQYVAVATDGGVSVINETDGSVVDSVLTSSIGKVWLTSTGDLYYPIRVGSSNLYSVYDIYSKSDGFASSYTYNLASTPRLFNEVNRTIAVIEGGSSVDGTSNTILIGTSSHLDILQEKQGDESNGSVKYYTKDEITEELVGDIRGAWGFNTNSSLANGDDIQDVSTQDTDMTAVADGGGIGVVNGVRGKAFSFDGTNDYLTQKVYEDESGSTWGPTYHGLSLASGQAFARVEGVDLSSYATAANDYMLVVADPEGDVAWGYIDTAGTGETLGSELITNGGFETYTGTQDDGTSDTFTGWGRLNVNDGQGDVVDATTTVNSGSNALKAIRTIGPARLVQDITVTPGKLYKVSFYTRGDGAHAGYYHIYDNTNNTGIRNYETGISGTTYTEKIIYFTAPSGCTSARLYLEPPLVAGYAYYDDVSIKEVTSTQIDGVKIMSTLGGSTQNWAGISASFNYNASSYTFDVRKTDFQITGDLTVGAWVKPSVVTGQYYTVMTNEDSSSGFRLFYNNSAGGFQFRAKSASTWEQATHSSSLTQNEWQYVSGVYSAGNYLKLYINGQEVASDDTVAASIVDAYGPFGIGARPSAPSGTLWNGTIDEPFITAEALSADQIKNMFDTGCRAMGGTPGTGTCTGIDESSTTNNLAGSTNIVNAVAANSGGTSAVVATDGSTGAVSVLDLTADKLVDTISTSTTPALVNNDSSALAVARFNSTYPQLIVGSAANGVSVINSTLVSNTQNTTSAYSKSGTDSLKIDNSSSAIDSLHYFAKTLTNANYTYSFYAYTDGNQVTSSDLVPYLNNGEILTSVTYEDAGGGWTRVYGTARGFASSKNFGVVVKAGKTVYIDAVQLEAKAYPTTYADGSLGTGYSWSGTEHNSSSARSSDSLRHSSSTNIDGAEGTLSFWIKPSTDWREGATKGIMQIYNGTTQNAPFHIEVYPSSNNFVTKHFGSGTILTKGYSVDENWKGKWKHVVVSWSNTADSSDFYVDGTLATNSSGTWQDISGDINAEIFIGELWNGSGESNSTISDLRIFDQPLTAAEITDLYNQGLQTHTNSSEAIDRYPTTATYTSPVLDLSANGAWGGTPFSVTDTWNGGAVTYESRSSVDNSTWSNWQSITGNDIGSDARRYFQWRANFTSSTNHDASPTLSEAIITYVQDSTAPVNPAVNALGYSTASTSSANLTSGSSNWYNYSNPKFTWVAATDDAPVGESSSGLDGYYILFTTTEADSPVDHVGSDCYTYVSDDEEDGGQIIIGTDPASCTLANGTYYLRIQTLDHSGNVSDASTLFTYSYDEDAPDAPLAVSSTTVGYSADNSFGFYWPAASDNGPSGLAGYEYKTGSTDPDDPFSDWQTTTETSVDNVAAYAQGQNIFYVRSLDNAGNYSATTSNIGVAPFYYNDTAPTAPSNLAISPVTTSDSPATSNVFTVTWDKPASYSGEIARYYYCVNCTPSASTMTETTSSETVNRTLTDFALATQQGKNTFYILAEDNNLSTTTGIGNINYDAYSTIDFYASTTAPTAPANVTISDVSDRSTDVWRLTLAWDDPGDDAGVDHYTIYRSTDNDSFTEIGETSSTAYTDSDLTQSQTYYYKIKAFDNASSSSLYSSTVNLAPEGKYTSPPTHGGTPTVTVGSTTATITWTTGRDAFGTVDYGKTTSYGSSAAESTATSSHSVKVTGLAPGVTYHYRVLNLDTSELVGYDRDDAYSADYTFTTLNTANISSVFVTDIGLDSAVVNWTTASLATSQVEYGLTTDYGSLLAFSTVATESSHSARLTNLTHSTEYNFRVRGTTIDGDDIVSDNNVFETITFPAINALVMNTNQAAAGATVVLAWSTNVPTTAKIEYQAVELDKAVIEADSVLRQTLLNKAAAINNSDIFSTEVLQSLSRDELNSLPVIAKVDATSVYQGELQTKHLQRISGLSDGSIYIITIRGIDRYGNEAISDPIRYVTGADTRAPIISNQIIETPLTGTGSDTKAQIIVSWETDEPAYGQVFYGIGTGNEYPNQTEKDQMPTNKHVIVIRDLEPTTSYHLKIYSEDLSGNAVESQDIVIVTPTAQKAAFDIVLKNLEDIFGFLKF